MINSSLISLRFSLFRNSHQSFVAALDAARIHHEQLHLFSSQPQASGIVETITALSEAMPWNAIAKVIVTWINARNSREVIIQTIDGRIIHAKGYSADEIQRFLPDSNNITVIDTKP